MMVIIIIIIKIKVIIITFTTIIMYEAFQHTLLVEDSRGMVVSDQWTTSNCLLLTCTYNKVQYNVRAFMCLFKMHGCIRKAIKYHERYQIYSDS